MERKIAKEEFERLRFEAISKGELWKYKLKLLKIRAEETSCVLNDEKVEHCISYKVKPNLCNPLTWLNLMIGIPISMIEGLIMYVEDAYVTMTTSQVIRKKVL